MNDKFTLLWEGTAETLDYFDHEDVDGYRPRFGDNVGWSSAIRILRRETKRLDSKAQWEDSADLVVENFEHDSLGGGRWVEIDRHGCRDARCQELYLRGKFESGEEEEGFGPYINCNIIQPMGGEWIASMVAGFLDCLGRLNKEEAELVALRARLAE